MKAVSTHKQYFHIEVQDEFVASLTATDYKDPPTVTMVGGGYKMTEGEELDRLEAEEQEEANRDADAVANGRSSVVRRLTPLECTRLQGFPDGWVDIGDWVDSKGKTHKDADSPKYKALGNSIATPFWFWLLRRISAQYERPATLGSLFDGISGFCLCWAKANGGPESVLWASEIEEFPIAVAKKHFGDDDTGEQGDYYEAIQRSYPPKDV